MIMYCTLLEISSEQPHLRNASPFCLLEVTCDEGVVKVEEAKADVVEDQVKALAQGDGLVIGLGKCLDGLLLCVGEVQNTCVCLYAT